VDRSEAKRRVGRAAAERVEEGQRLGLGTGSTVACFLEALANRIEDEGLDVAGVPTSEGTAERCRRLGIPLTTLEEAPTLDLTVDGADEVAPGLELIKGGGGALFREKVVASATEDYLAIVDATKEVDQLGARHPVPVEVVGYALPVVQRRLEDLAPELRIEEGLPFETDSGHGILDLATGPIDAPHTLADRLEGTVGVLEHGLFLRLADRCLLADEDSVTERTR
jgi:ribose 5-phosphate isomerase A